jgi:hypothetical protein
MKTNILQMLILLLVSSLRQFQLRNTFLTG